MRLRKIIWKIHFIEKLKIEHEVVPKEVESVIFGEPHVLRVEKGKVKGEACMKRLDRLLLDDI